MRQIEEIITDQLGEEDWEALLSLDLKPVHMAYLWVFLSTENRPMDKAGVWFVVSERYGYSKSAFVFFDQVSAALKRRGTPYRLRAVTQNPRKPSGFRIVKVVPLHKATRTNATVNPSPPDTT